MLKEQTKAGLAAAREEDQHLRLPPEALRTAVGSGSRDGHQGRQERRRHCPAVQGPPGYRLRATGATKVREGSVAANSVQKSTPNNLQSDTLSCLAVGPN